LRQIQVKTEAEKESVAFGQSTQESINEVLKLLGMSKTIEISVDRRGAIPKLSFNPDANTNKISNYSEGQRHKLALAIFLASIMSNERKYDYIVLDDPVITMDLVSYHNLKSLLYSPRIGSKRNHLIILTHNIHYLYVQISNLLDNEKASEFSSVFELSPKKCSEVPLDLLRTDDLSLFINQLSRIETISDVSYIYWLALKISRIFLDQKLRLSGIKSNSNPSDEIDMLNSGDQVRSELKKLMSRNITPISRKPNPKIAEVFTLLNSLDDFLVLLGFQKIVPGKTYSVLNAFDLQTELPSVLYPSTITEEILLLGRQYHFYSGDERSINFIKNYLDHPRYQTTENLFGLKAKMDY
jgi:energy-coupling factor transporter ATP-binding protein EcfA2